MTLPTTTAYAGQVIEESKPQLILVVIALLVILISSLISSFMSILLSPPFGFNLPGYDVGFISIDVLDPAEYLLLFMAGIAVIIAKKAKFGSRRRLTTAGYLMLFGSVMVPLTSFLTVFSLLIISDLHLLGFEQAFIAILYQFIIGIIELIFILLAMTMVGLELFALREKRFALTGLGLYIASVTLPFGIKVMAFYGYLVLKPPVTGFNLYYYLITTISTYLSFAGLTLMALAYIFYIAKYRGQKLNQRHLIP